MRKAKSGKFCRASMFEYSDEVLNIKIFRSEECFEKSTQILILSVFHLKTVPNLSC